MEEAAEIEKVEEKKEEKKVLGKLVFIRPDGTEGGEHPLVEGENKIGRNYGEVFKADGYLSPEHGSIEIIGNEFILRDKGSLNGVFYKTMNEEILEPGDIFRMGQELMRFDEVAPPESLEDGTDIMGSPNKGCWGRLTLIVGYGVDGNAYPLMGESIKLGREIGDVLFPEDGYVSGEHLEISKKGGEVVLKDLHSSNGTFLKIRNEKNLATGSFVLMGQQLFRLELV